MPATNHPAPKKRRWPWLAALLFAGGALGGLTLRYGNPAWHERIYRFQADGWPGYDNSWIPVPDGYTGVWRAWRPGEAEPFFVGRYENGQPAGEHYSRHADGMVTTVPYVDGKREGVMVVLAPDGTRTETPWKADAVEGEVRVSDPHGLLVLTLPVADNLPEGVSRSWWPNGVFSGEETFRRGKRHGRSRAYREDGTLAMETDYVDGRLDGLQRSYYEDGQTPLSDTHFKNDVLDGVSVEYDETGAEIARKYFKTGLLVDAEGVAHPEEPAEPAPEDEPAPPAAPETETESDAPPPAADAPREADAPALTAETARRALIVLATATPDLPLAARDALVAEDGAAPMEGVATFGPWTAQPADGVFHLLLVDEAGSAHVRTGHFRHAPERGWRAEWSEPDGH